MDSVNCVVIPGDTLHSFKCAGKNDQVVVGPGLRKESGNVIASKPGILRFKEPNIYWIDSHIRRYVPVRGDCVIGIVTQKAGDIFRVDIGGSELASLSYLTFEGATKRNRPDVKVGDLVYAKLLVATKDMEPELVCMNSQGKSGGFGVIGDGGLLIHCSLNLVRKVLSPECPLLKLLGKSMPYETAIGMNGRVWIKGRSTVETIALANGISDAEFITNDKCKQLSQTVMDKILGFT
ncbi:exosome complex component RRP40-like [Tubulanus polymorphus]|uniref:exosome complex component RRP40-like n=1 Tax=Tubulanus polymorphus TaxID=672921 RepID=UPI003DA5363C